MHRLLVCAVLAFACLSSGCAAGPERKNPKDPLESMNRKIYRFNDKVDRAVLKPVARGYVKVVPEIGRRGVTNFLRNLGMVVTTLNDVLQLKGEKVPVDIARVVTNTVFGLGGIIDVASELNIEYRNEDFGQTLGYWGVGPGWYIMLPLLGPSTNRDLVGAVGDWYTSPWTYVDEDDEEWAWGAGVLQAVHQRANLLGFDSVLEQQLDPYVFVRSIYLQNRLNKVYDGNPPKEDFGFDEEE